MKTPIDYFPQSEIDQRNVCERGYMQPIEKLFDGVKVTLNLSTRNGAYLQFAGLKTASSLTISHDYEQTNQIVQLILEGDKACD